MIKELTEGTKFVDLEATVVASDGWHGEDSKRRQKLTIEVEGKRFPFTNWPNTGKDLSVGDIIKLGMGYMGLYQGELQVYLSRGSALEIIGKADVEKIEEDNNDRAKKELVGSLDVASELLGKYADLNKLSEYEHIDIITRWAISMNMSKRS